MSSRKLQKSCTGYYKRQSSKVAILHPVRTIPIRRITEGTPPFGNALLLLETDLDAGEVAFLLGLEELNSFTRAFREWEGMTPTQWRRSNTRRS
jgi:methylphosphotriester-DNA--protein-cysteine methyltransferase